jgi:hypothetical protein
MRRSGVAIVANSRQISTISISCEFMTERYLTCNQKQCLWSCRPQLSKPKRSRPSASDDPQLPRHWHVAGPARRQVRKPRPAPTASRVVPSGEVGRELHY